MSIGKKTPWERAMLAIAAGEKILGRAGAGGAAHAGV